MAADDVINILKYKLKHHKVHNSVIECSPDLIEAVLEHNNRQKAEIERLQEADWVLNKAVKEQRDELEYQDKEIKRLKAEIEETNEADREAEVQALSESKENAKLFCEAINHAKSESIKEFAERLKAVSHPYADTQIVFELQIDNLVKEMVGDE